MTTTPYQVLPPLSDDEYAALKADIAERGILVPIELDEDGAVLDGHHRLRAWEELRAEGLTPADYPKVVRAGLSEPEKRAHARLLNAARRHLSREQRRDLVAQALVDDPQSPDRRIAAEVGVDHKTVAAVRRHLESIGEIPQCDRETADGRSYPARRRPRSIAAALEDAFPVHPALACITDMTVVELADLADDIKQHGLFQPIVLDGDGTLLDGRQRLKACTMAGVAPRFTTYQGDDPVAYIVDVNLNRASYSLSQRAMWLAVATDRHGLDLAQASHRALGDYVDAARFVLKHAPESAAGIMAGATSLKEAHRTARGRAAQSVETLRAPENAADQGVPMLQASEDEPSSDQTEVAS